jgi:hypothetical protein
MAWNVEWEIFKDFLKNIQRFSEKYSDVPAPRVGARRRKRRVTRAR